MRTPLSLRARALLLGAAAAALVVGAAGGRAQQQPASIDEAGWQGVLGVRTPVSTAQRYVVLLKPPSLAAQVRAAGGTASEKETRSWSAKAIAQQEQFLARLAAVGARIAPEYRYTRVINGFSARLDPTSLALLDGDREVLGVYPVRIAYPAQVSEPGGDGGVLPTAVADLEIAGLDGSGVTVALLDTGVDPSHPYLRQRVLSGVDVIDPGSGGIAQPHPTVPGRPERHATELAGIIAGTDGPDGLHGIAPGASILPVRVGGWQPNAEGGYSVYSRTDQIIAGLEAAVDPNGDGDVHDAARIALIGMVEPYAAFVDGPLPRAIAGAADLDMLTIVPAGNDGRAGPGYGSIAGPGAAEAAVTVGAADGRLAAPTVRVLVRAGLRVLYEEDVPLGGAPSRTVTADVVLIDQRTASRGIAGLFPDGTSAVAGHAVLLPRAALSGDTVEEATSAGALSVLVDGPLPAGAFSLDVPPGVPVVGLATGVVAQIRALLAAGIPVTVSIGDVQVATRESGGSVAAFSSRGLAFDGSLKPDLAAPGVSVPTSEPGREECCSRGHGGGCRRPRPGASVARRAGSPRTARRVRAARRPRPHRLGSGARRPSRRRPARDLRRALGSVVRRRTSERGLRARRPDHERLDAPALGVHRQQRDRAEGRADHVRPAACPPPTGPERRGRGSREHRRSLGRGGSGDR
jgi:subtilisin family serine protease